MYFCLWLPLFIMSPIQSHRRPHVPVEERLSGWRGMCGAQCFQGSTMSELFLGRALRQGYRCTFLRLICTRCRNMMAHARVRAFRKTWRIRKDDAHALGIVSTHTCTSALSLAPPHRVAANFSFFFFRAPSELEPRVSQRLLAVSKSSPSRNELTLIE